MRCLIGILALLTCSRQETPKTAVAKLQIEPGSKVYHPGEPMMMRFTVENPAETEAELEEPVDYLEGLEIKDPETRVVKAVGKTKDFKRQWKVEGRGFIGRTVDLSKLLGAVPEDKEGFYTIQWHFGDQTSNEIKIFVIRDYLAQLETNYGTLTFEFYPDSAPFHVLNFVKLAREGKYNESRFTWLIPGFVVQGGEMKDPPKPLKAEFNDRKHVFGTVSMAHGPEPDTASCEFFICFTERPDLDRRYTVFAYVTEGKDVLKQLETVKTDHNPCKQCGRQLPATVTEHCGKHHEDKPVEPIIIKKVTLTTRKK